MRIYEVLNESIEDKGIFKAVFIGGAPGAGKSTVIQKITDGTISPKIVNTDKAFEFLASKHGVIPNSVTWTLFGPTVKTITKEMLYHYLNGMLPIFIDGTMSNIETVHKRVGLLESIGYDVAMVWVNVDYETALRRAKARSRQVDVDFIKQAIEATAENKEFLKHTFRHFYEIDNNTDISTNTQVNEMYKATTEFYTSPLMSVIGKRHIKKLREANEKYLVPTIYSKEYLQKLLSVWYTK